MIMDTINSVVAIRPGHEGDVARVMEIFDGARAFMRACGNSTQWTGAYPSAQTVRGDIAAGNLFVAEVEGKIVGCCTLVVGRDPYYAEIDGRWLNDEPYGTMHRLASSGDVRGIADVFIDFCASRIGNLRIDTHADNLPMQRAILRNGFSYCGVVRVADGSPRLAYQRTL